MTLDEHLTGEQLTELNAQFFDFDTERHYACLEHEGIFYAFKMMSDTEYHLHASHEAPHPQHPKKERKYLQI